MRINKIAATAIATSLSASLALGVAGPAFAAVHSPNRAAAVAAFAPDAANTQLDAVAKLGDTLSLAAKLAKDTQAKSPNVDSLKDQQTRLQAKANELIAALRTAAGAQPPAEAPAKTPADNPAKAPADNPVEAPANPPVVAPIDTPAQSPANAPVQNPAKPQAAVPAENPAEAPAKNPAEVSVETPSLVLTPSDAGTPPLVLAPAQSQVSDPLADIQAQVNKLIADVNDLLTAVTAVDGAKISAAISNITADLQALLASVPKLLSSEMAMPLPAQAQPAQ
jgi:hypothetical protein